MRLLLDTHIWLWTACSPQPLPPSTCNSSLPWMLSLAVIAGAVGALGAGLTSEAARWLWESILATLSFGWNALAG